LVVLLAAATRADVPTPTTEELRSPLIRTLVAYQVHVIYGDPVAREFIHRDPNSGAATEVDSFVMAPFADRGIPLIATIAAAHGVALRARAKADSARERDELANGRRIRKSVNGGVIAGSLLPSLGAAPTGDLPFEQALVYGARDFIIERAEQELVFSAFHMLDRAFKDRQRGGQLSTLFPRTKMVVEAASNGIYGASLLESLRSAVRVDIDGFPATLPELIARNVSDPTARTALLLVGTFAEVGSDIRDGMEPFAALSRFATSPLDTPVSDPQLDRKMVLAARMMGHVSRDAALAIAYQRGERDFPFAVAPKLLSLVSRLERDENSGEEVRVRDMPLFNVLRRNITRNVWAGIMADSLAKLLPEFREAKEDLRPRVANLLPRLTAVQRAHERIVQLGAKVDSSARVSAWDALYVSTRELVGAMQVLFPDDAQAMEKLDTLMEYADRVHAIHKYIARGDRATGIVIAMHLVAELAAKAGRDTADTQRIVVAAAARVRSVRSAGASVDSSVKHIGLLFQADDGCSTLASAADGVDGIITLADDALDAARAVVESAKRAELLVAGSGGNTGLAEASDGDSVLAIAMADAESGRAAVDCITAASLLRKAIAEVQEAACIARAAAYVADATARHHASVASARASSARNLNLLRYSALFADLADAGGSEDVEAALDGFASPVGSWRAKRTLVENADSTYLYLNAYLGGIVGYETEFDGWRPNSLGIWVPVGLEWGWRRDGSSWGIFLQFADFGNMAAYRIRGGDGTSVMPEIGLRQLFAPGLYVVVGVSNVVPVTVAIGHQYGPSLRTINGKPESVHRASVSLAIDAVRFGF